MRAGLRAALGVALALSASGCLWTDFARSLRRGELEYRIEHRPERVCVPVKDREDHVLACARALRLLGGGSIEVP